MCLRILQCFLGFEWIYAFCGNFSNLFSDETRKTPRTGAVPTLNLQVKSHASKQSDDLPPREYLTLNVDDKAKTTVLSVCKPLRFCGFYALIFAVISRNIINIPAIFRVVLFY